VSVAAAEPTAARDHPVRRGFGRRKFDKQPTQPAAVLIATNGHPVPGSVIRTARALAAGEPVAVVTIARIYGSSFGLPNPGLMPTKREMADQRAIVDKAVRALERAGVEAWGQIAASRRPAKAISQVAAARGSRYVLVIRSEQARWRTAVEGDLAKEVARKLGRDITVEAVSP
jgi:hypothetical protein